MSHVMRKNVFGFPIRSDTNRAEILDLFGFRDFGFCTIYVAKTSTLISCTVYMQLICVFVFAYAKNRFSHDPAHMALLNRIAVDSGLGCSCILLAILCSCYASQFPLTNEHPQYRISRRNANIS